MPAPTSNRDPLVSVIILCHNYSQYLPEALASVRNQTFRDFEILVIDSGSTDDTASVARHLAAESNHNIPIRLFCLSNVGPSVGRNFGVGQARGRYFVPLDGDDKLAPEYLARTVPLLDADPKLGFVYVRIQCFGDSEETVRQPEYDFTTLCRENQAPYCSLVRKAAYEEAGGYDPENFGYYEDWQLWIRMGAQGWHGRLLNEPLFFYRYHFDSSLSFYTRRLHRIYRAFIVSRQAELYLPEEVEAARRALKEMPTGWHRRPPMRDLRELQALLAEHPGNRHVMFFLAQTLAKLDRKTESARLLHQLLYQEPDDIQALELLASLSVAGHADPDPTNHAARIENVSGDRLGMQFFPFSDHLPEGKLLEGERAQLELRHATIGDWREPSIYLHPPAQLRFEVPASGSGRFASAIAVQPEAWGKPGAGGCEFSLLLDRVEVFRKAINPTLVSADRCWHRVVLDVPATPGRVHEFIFRTQAIGWPPDFRWALWRRPVFCWQTPKHHNSAHK